MPIGRSLVCQAARGVFVDRHVWSERPHRFPDETMCVQCFREDYYGAETLLLKHSDGVIYKVLF